MAYYRPSMLTPPSVEHSNGSAFNFSSEKDVQDGNDKHKEDNPRPLSLFSVDLSHLSPMVQYVLLAGGLIVFMCLYGYYQELVIYGWFDRKLSIFSTFLHFLGCLIFAQVQRNLSRSSTTNNRTNPNTGCVPSHGGFMVFTLGSAPPRVALFYYVLLIFVRTGAQGMSNLSMTQINYPAKVLFKSATPIVTMIIGLLWFKKTYPTRDYIVVLLLVLGLYVFVTGDSTASPQSTKLGIFYVTVSMFGSAALPMIQEHCMVTYHASIEDLLYHTFLGSALASFVMSCVTGELLEGVLFLLRTGSLHAWFIMFAFTMFGFIGTNFSAGLTLQYGALVNGITNTFRKALTLGLSFLLFPERNLLTNQKIFGSVIFFCGLLVRIFSKTGVKTYVNNNADGEKEKLMDIEAGTLRSTSTIVESHSKNHSLSVHTTYFGNNASTDFGQLLASTDEPLSNTDEGVEIEGNGESGKGKLHYVDPETLELERNTHFNSMRAKDYNSNINSNHNHRHVGGNVGGNGGIAFANSLEHNRSADVVQELAV